RLTELAANSDRVAVIVDGRCVRLLEGSDRTAENIAETLVRDLGGGPTEATVTRGGPPPAGTWLELAGVSDHGQAFAALRFEVPKGRVTALMGVEGSGGREIVRGCAGLRRVHGRVLVDGKPLSSLRLHDHVCYVSADRATSLFANLTVGENLVIRL